MYIMSRIMSEWAAAWCRTGLCRHRRPSLSRSSCSIVFALSIVLSIDSAGGQQLLLNPGFEQGSGEPLNPYGISDWVGYGNQERSVQFAFDGSASLKMFGGAGNAGVYQTIPLPPGRRLHFAARLMSPTFDAIGGTARAGLRIEFLGSSNDPTVVWTANAAAADDIWIPVNLETSAPPAIGVGRMVLIWIDGGATTGSVYWDETQVRSEANVGSDLLSNTGFEAGPGGLSNPYGINDWIAFGNAERSSEANSVGSASLKLFGGVGFSGVFQDFRYSPGSPITATGLYHTRGADHIGGEAMTGMVLEWPGPVLDVVERLDIGSETSQNQWIELRAIAVPPPGTMAARVVLAFDDGLSPSGAIYIDAVSAFAVLPGDVNCDAFVNGVDVQAFMQTLPNGAAPSASACACDINADGIVDAADVPLFVIQMLN